MGRPGFAATMFAYRLSSARHGRSMHNLCTAPAADQPKKSRTNIGEDPNKLTIISLLLVPNEASYVPQVEQQCVPPFVPILLTVFSKLQKVPINAPSRGKHDWL